MCRGVEEGEEGGRGMDGIMMEGGERVGSWEGWGGA